MAYRITSGGLVNGENLSGALSREAGEDAGTYAILQGTLAASTNYALTYVGADLTITQRWLVVRALDQSRVYGETNPVLTISYSGFVGTDGVTNLTELPQASTVAEPTSPVENYEIRLTGGSATNYQLRLTNGILSVLGAELTVVVDNASRPYGATNPVFSGTITGIQNGDDITATYASTATVNSTVGTYPITPALVDPTGKLGNYTWGAASANGTLSVTAAGLTVAANNASRVYGATNPVFSGTITGIQNGDNITATYATAATITSGVGAYPITPTLVDPGSKLSNYTVSSRDGTLGVTPASLTGRADGKSRLYGASNPPFTVTYSGFVNGQDAGVVTGVLSGSTPATTNSPVGSYPISVWGQSVPNYTIQYVDGILAVQSAPLLVRGDDASRGYGQANPGFTATISGWVNGEDTNVLGGALELSSPAQTNSPVGSYPIIPAGMTSTNYTLTFTNGTLTVAPAALTVTADPRTKLYGDGDPALAYRITSGGLVNGENLSGALSREAGEDVGTYAILQGTLAASTNYALTYVGADLTITHGGWW